MEKEKKKKIILLVVGIIVMLSIFIGITYAYFSGLRQSDTKRASIGKVNVKYEDDNSNTVIVNDMLPIYDEDMLEKANKYGFTITNTGDDREHILISLTDIVLPKELKSKYFKWALYSSNTKLSEGNFNSVSSLLVIRDDDVLEKNESKNYQLYIWVSESGNVQNDMMNKTFTAKIKVDASQYQLKLLSTKIIEDNSPLTTTQPDFNTIATTDEGLVKGKDIDGDTYYFRGAVQDNYVYLPGYSYKDAETDEYKNLFKIVRINGSGTTRIIPVGNNVSGLFNINNDDEKYVGYTYDNGKTCNLEDNCDTTIGISSTIKEKVEEWYDNNMSEADKYIVVEKFCNDTGVHSTSTTTKDEETYNNIYYKAYGRNASSKKPSFICSTTTKEYGGLYNLKVGLLSVDEVVFAGGLNGLTNKSFYLYTGYPYSLGSPSSFTTGLSNVFVLRGDGALTNYGSVKSSSVLLPVLNLKSEVLYSSGDGTKTNPYQIFFN